MWVRIPSLLTPSPVAVGRPSPCPCASHLLPLKWAWWSPLCPGVLVDVGHWPTASQILVSQWVTFTLQSVCPGHFLASVVHPVLSLRFPCASTSWLQNGERGEKGGCDSGRSGGEVAVSGSTRRLVQHLRPTLTAGRSRSARDLQGVGLQGLGAEDAVVPRGTRGIALIPFPGQLRQLQHELEDRPLHEVE